MKKTMKIAMAVALLFTATLSAHAQFSAKSSDRVPDRFHMGLRAGFTSNIYTGDNGEGDNVAFLFPTGGLALDFQVAPVPVFVGLGLNYVNYGAKWEYRGYTEKVDDAHSIQLPITAGYHINVAPNLFINPFLGGFMAYNFNDDFYEQFNYGLRVGCGMNFGRLTFDIGYDLGLANLANDDYQRYHKDDIHSGTFFMTIGINWAGDR